MLNANNSCMQRKNACRPAEHHDTGRRQETGDGRPEEQNAAEPIVSKAASVSEWRFRPQMKPVA
jgi:hypothetical protein